MALVLKTTEASYQEPNIISQLLKNHIPPKKLTQKKRK